MIVAVAGDRAVVDDGGEFVGVEDRSMLMPEPLSPWIVAPELLVTLIVKLTVASTAPPVMPWRPPSIQAADASLVICTPLLFCASTPSLLPPTVVDGFDHACVGDDAVDAGPHRVRFASLHDGAGRSC